MEEKGKEVGLGFFRIKCSPSSVCAAPAFSFSPASLSCTEDPFGVMVISVAHWTTKRNGGTA